MARTADSRAPGRWEAACWWLGITAVIAAACWIVYYGRASVAAGDAVDRAFGEGTARPAEYRWGGLLLETDAYYWLGYAQDQRAAGAWRAPRWTQRDNPPEGRPVHWASPFLWLVRGAGEVAVWRTGLPFDQASEIGVLAIGPGLHLLALVVGSALLVRRQGWLAAGVFALALTGQRESLWTFHALRPDHQALYGVTAMLVLLLPMMGGLGWTCAGEDARGCQCRRLWFVAAGLAGALGIWVSATVTVVLQGILACAVAGALVPRRFRRAAPAADAQEAAATAPVTGAPEETGGYDPEVWRWWGWTGAGACLVAWLVEYAPALPWGRMEVNHPLYALQWLALGEGLRLWSGWLAAGRPWTARRALGLAVAAGVALAPLLLLLFGPADLHALRDPVMRALHRHIGEFRPYARAGSLPPLTEFLVTYGPFLVPLLLAPLLALRRNTPARLRVVLVTLWPAVLSLLALGWLQMRWMLLFAIALSLLAAFCAAALSTGGRLARTLGVLLLLAGACHAGRLMHTQDCTVRDIAAGRELDRHTLNVACLKLLALDLARHKGAADWRFLAEASQAPLLHYFGRIPVMSSLYWENRAGLADTVAFLDDESGETARAIASRRGLTHILIPSGPAAVRLFHDLAGRSPSADGTANTLARRLGTGWIDVPDWIQVDFALLPIATARRSYRGATIEAPLHIYRILPEAAASGRE